MFKRNPITLCLVLILLSGLANAKIYLKYGTIKGDVTDVDYKDWIELKAIGFNLERAVDMADLGNTQSRYANTQFKKIVGQKDFTASSPLLFLATANGTIEPTVEIHCVQADTKNRSIPYFKVILGEALIDRFEQFASEDSIPSETITLAYTAIEIRSGGVDDNTGQLRKEVTASWNLRTGEGGGGTTPPPNTAPTISSMGAQSTPEDTAKTITFTIGDAQTSAGSLQLSKTSSNNTLLPANRISLGGSGGNRTVTLNPVANQFGSATVTVTVSDGSLTKSTSFILTVTPDNDHPVIVPISSLQFIRSTPITGIIVSDVDAGTNILSLAATVTQGSLFTNAVIPELTVLNNGFAAVVLDGPLDALNTLINHSSGLMYQSYPNFTGTDTLQLQLTDEQGATSIQQNITLNVFASSYHQWRQTHFSDDLSTPSSEAFRWGEQADPDGDGLPNLLEYALGLNPDLPDAGHAPQLMETVIDGKRYYTITIDRIIDADVAVFVEVCNDLDGNGWTSAVTEIDVSNVTQSTEDQQITFQDKKSIDDTAARFYRITAVRR